MATSKPVLRKEDSTVNDDAVYVVCNELVLHGAVSKVALMEARCVYTKLPWVRRWVLFMDVTRLNSAVLVY